MKARITVDQAARERYSPHDVDALLEIGEEMAVELQCLADDREDSVPEDALRLACLIDRFEAVRRRLDGLDPSPAETQLDLPIPAAREPAA